MDGENLVWIHNGYYSAVKKNEIIKFGSKQIELEHILHKVIQT